MPTSRKTPAKKPAARKKAAPQAKPATKRKAGRPPIHTPALAKAVCDRLMTGESLRSITCDEAMPSMPTVLSWIHDDVDGFAAQYARARATQAEVLAEEVIAIADEPPRMETIEWEDVTAKGKKTKRIPVVVAVDGADVANRRLRADARKWYASKVAPKKYGDKLEVGLTEDTLVTFRDFTGRKGEAPGQPGGSQA